MMVIVHCRQHYQKYGGEHHAKMQMDYPHQTMQNIEDNFWPYISSTCLVMDFSKSELWTNDRIRSKSTFASVPDSNKSNRLPSNIWPNQFHRCTNEWADWWLSSWGIN